MEGKRFLAEGIGTFILVFVGCMAIIVNESYAGALGHVGVSMVFGLVVMALIYAVGNISGAHFNPAVTFGFLFAGRMARKAAPAYIACQFIGAIAAGALLRLFFPESATLGATLPNVDIGRAFCFEVAFSFLLMFVILNVSTGHMEKGIMAGVAVGGTIAVAAMVGGPLTGASMNPARSLAPALFSANYSSLWIYMIAPVLGACLARPACRLTQEFGCCIPEGDSGNSQT